MSHPVSGNLLQPFKLICYVFNLFMVVILVTVVHVLMHIQTFLLGLYLGEELLGYMFIFSR